MRLSHDATTDLTSERVLNTSSIVSPGGTTTNRVVSLAATGVTVVTPTALCVEMHIQNRLDRALNYGGSGVGATTGGIIWPNSSMVVRSPQPGFKIYFYNSGAIGDLDIVEFFRD